MQFSPENSDCKGQTNDTVSPKTTTVVSTIKDLPLSKNNIDKFTAKNE